MGYHFTVRKQERKLTEEQERDAQELLKDKITYQCVRRHIARRHIWNIDETASKVLPLQSKCWTAKGGTGPSVPDSKRQISVVLAVGTEPGQALAQLIFSGSTAASLPVGPLPEDITVTCTSSHWSSADSLLQFMEVIQNHIHMQDGVVPWLCVLDCATSHTSSAFRSEATRRFPQCSLAYVVPGATPCSQPCDISFMYPLKVALRHHTAMH
eukprot:4636556-Amphidinium_carterae.2